MLCGPASPGTYRYLAFAQASLNFVSSFFYFPCPLFLSVVNVRAANLRYFVRSKMSIIYLTSRCFLQLHRPLLMYGNDDSVKALFIIAFLVLKKIVK